MLVGLAENKIRHLKDVLARVSKVLMLLSRARKMTIFDAF